MSGPGQERRAAPAIDDGQAAPKRDKPWIFRTYAGHSTAREFEPPLSRQSRQGPDRPVDRLRPADPDRLRQRPPTRARRSRQGRRRDLPHRRHAGAVRGHPARRDEHVDDHQRHRAVADGALCRGRRRTGRAARRPAGHDAKRHRQGISVARLVCVRARPVAAADQGPHPVLRSRDAEVEPDERLLLPSAGSGRDAGAGAQLRAGDRDRRARHGARFGRDRRRRLRRRRRRPVVLRQRRHALRHRTRQDARLRRAVGRDHPRALSHHRSRQAAVPLRRAGQLARPDRAAAGEQRLSHPDRDAVGGAVEGRARPRGAIAGVERGARPAAAVRSAMVAAAAADHGVRDRPARIRRHLRRQRRSRAAGRGARDARRRPSSKRSRRWAA